MRAIILSTLLILPLCASADQTTAANAALDYDMASALQARAKFSAAGLPLPCMGCAAAWPAQKAALLALQVSICESSYASSPEYASACVAWWKTVFQ